jgi:hypothetical protein
MILLKLDGEKVKEVTLNVSSSYAPQSDEVLVEDLPPLQLASNEIAYIYYRNGVIEYEKIIREGSE